MRCALVALDLGLGLAGIDNAMSGQAQAAEQTGTPLDVIVVNATGEGKAKGVRYLRHHALRSRGTLSRLMKARLLSSVAELQSYDAIFLRWPTGVDLDPLHFLRRTRARVATVHHAKDFDEQLAMSRAPSMLARIALAYVQGRRILRSVDGVVGVTDEIRDYHIKMAGRALPARTVANGIEVAAIANTGFVPYDGHELRLVVLCSSYAVWHGVDRLLAGLRAYRGNRRIVIDMIGNGSGAPGTEEQIGSATLRHHGHLSGAPLSDAMRRATVGIGTLAFFRTGLQQGASLKTREYIARGMPLVLGYEDVDVPADCPFVLQVPSDDSALSIDAVIAFAERVSAEAGLAATIRTFAENVLDWKVKVPLFTRFAEELLASPPRRSPAS